MGHNTWVTNVAYSPDSKYVLTGSADTTARLWKTEPWTFRVLGSGERDHVAFLGEALGCAFLPSSGGHHMKNVGAPLLRLLIDFAVHYNVKLGGPVHRIEFNGEGLTRSWR